MKYLNYNEGHYRSKWLSKFINKLFINGKKIIIEKIVYCTFFLIKKKLKYYPLFFFFEVLEKIKIIIGLKYKSNEKNKKINVLKKNVFPILLNISQQYKKSIFWLIQAIKIRNEKNLCLKIYLELHNIFFNYIGNSIKQKWLYYKNIILFKTIRFFKW